MNNAFKKLVKMIVDKKVSAWRCQNEKYRYSIGQRIRRIIDTWRVDNKAHRIGNLTHYADKQRRNDHSRNVPGHCRTLIFAHRICALSFTRRSSGRKTWHRSNHVDWNNTFIFLNLKKRRKYIKIKWVKDSTKKFF